MEKYGGYQNVVDRKLWQQVRVQLNIPHSSSSGTNLRLMWEKYFGTTGIKQKQKKNVFVECVEKKLVPKITSNKNKGSKFNNERMILKRKKSVGTEQQLQQLIARTKYEKSSSKLTNGTLSSLNGGGMLNDEVAKDVSIIIKYTFFHF